MDKQPWTLTLDKGEHRYFVISPDGVGEELPSVTAVTDILMDFSRIDPAVLEQKRMLGQAVHKACELYDKNDLDFSTVDDAVAPYLEAWIKFLTETKFKITAIEQKVWSRKYHFAGTLDRTGILKKAQTVLDIKIISVMGPPVGIQLAGYEKAARESDILPPTRIVWRHGIQLKPNGKYQIEPYTDRGDWNTFLACLQIHNFRRKYYANDINATH